MERRREIVPCCHPGAGELDGGVVQNGEALDSALPNHVGPRPRAHG